MEGDREWLTRKVLRRRWPWSTPFKNNTLLDWHFEGPFGEIFESCTKTDSGLSDWGNMIQSWGSCVWALLTACTFPRSAPALHPTCPQLCTLWPLRIRTGEHLGWLSEINSAHVLERTKLMRCVWAQPSSGRRHCCWWHGAYLLMTYYLNVSKSPVSFGWNPYIQCRWNANKHECSGLIFIKAPYCKTGSCKRLWKIICGCTK